MPRKVYITGCGIVSPIGISADETLSALKNRQTGTGIVQRFDTAHRNIPVCEVKYGNEELRQMLRYDDAHRLLSRTALLGLVAAGQALQASHSQVPKCRMGLVSATTVGGMDYNEVHYRSLSAGDDNPQAVNILDCADVAQEIAETFGITSNVTTVSTACSSSANAIIVGARMIWNGLADKVLAGGADALTRFAINGFNTLQILSPTGCKPFDAGRNGVTLGEGAAYVMLESPATAIPDDILCELSGCANTGEAYHQTASSPDGEGAAMSIRQALASAELASNDIHYINAHGTGTTVNDLSEGKAIETVFGENIPPVSSTKGYTGHTLAAAGAVEAVISILSIRYGLLFPNVGFEKQMPELSFAPIKSLQAANVRHVLSNSFGFGGSNASLIFSQTSCRHTSHP
ncbi:MAG: beta-ketoacyl-[acyl-carrier-protein] synthase family protein [Bacteroidales bacterium]|jgi:3-oxoacyl-[acyl-carrier-protein] synthase-1|nr:beta-ketoacyl-[acyl-carrier-protein] synthase family protein [Bacteroidales bacterium]